MIQDIFAGLLLAVAAYGVRMLSAVREDLRRHQRFTRRSLLRHEARIARVEQLVPMPPVGAVE